MILAFTKNWSKKHAYWLCVTYYLLLCVALFARYDTGVSILQLNPFACFREVYYGGFTEWVVMAFNICYFCVMPWMNGIFIKNLKYNIFLCVLIGFFCEFLQLVLHRGVFDLGDIFLYCIGICMGGICKYIYEKKKSA